MLIRYMGTKRNIAGRVRRLIADLFPKGQVLDLFSGIGCVTESLAAVAPIHISNVLSFTAGFAGARFMGPHRYTPQKLIEAIRRAYCQAAEDEIRRKRDRLRDEQRAIDLACEALGRCMLEAHHDGSSTRQRRTLIVP